MKRRQQKLPPNQVLGGDSFFKPKVQAKLAMGAPGDKYEVEADRMADQVVNKTGSGDAVQKMEGEEEVQQKPLAASVTPLIQKMEAPEEEAPVQKMEEEEPVQAMEEEEPVQKMEEEEPVQAMEEEEVQTKKADNASTNSNIEGKLRKGSGGSKMDATTQTEMESGFGADFSAINIHNDSEAAQMSQDIGAQAFTHGNDVYFNEGKYNPDSKEGKHLLAHELTHTVQQKGMVQKKVQKKRITYNVTSTVAAPSLGKSSTTRVYKPTFKVEPYKKGSNWRVKIIHVTAKGDIEIVPFPATHIPNPTVGGNVTDNKAGGTNAGYHCDVIADLKDYTSTGGAGPRWHVTQATIDHENYHWNKEWKKTLNKYWRKAQRKIKRLKFSDTNTEAQAQVHFDTEVQTIIDKMHTDASIKYAALPDNAGSKPYKAGQKALNKMIRKIKRFRKSQKWKKC